MVTLFPATATTLRKIQALWAWSCLIAEAVFGRCALYDRTLSRKPQEPPWRFLSALWKLVISEQAQNDSCHNALDPTLSDLGLAWRRRWDSNPREGISPQPA